MKRKKGKSVSFDAMIKFFMQQYDIPTKKDVNILMARMDRLEKLIKVVTVSGKKGRTLNSITGKNVTKRKKPVITASDTVLEVIKKSRQGIGVSGLKAKIDFEDKKLRNIIFRLNNLGKIKRKSRGIYIAV